MTASKKTIPTIDISAAVDGTDVEGVAAELGEIARTTGFMQVVGHGIDPALFHAVYDASDQLWAFSNGELDELLSPKGHPFRGAFYGLDEHGERIFQRLQNTRIDTPEEAAALGYPPEMLDYFGGNAYPDLPELNEAISACFAEGRRLGSVLISLYSIEVGLGADGLAKHFARDVSYFAVQDYPAMTHPAPSPERIPMHSDSGAVTMLHQRGEFEGLAVRTLAGEQFSVPVVDDAIVVNTGDLMARWTNDLFPATPHAVVDGPVGTARRSIAMHYLPDVDTVVAPLDTCTTDGEGRYEPVSMYDWDQRYFEKRSLVLSLADED